MKTKSLAAKTQIRAPEKSVSMKGTRIDTIEYRGWKDVLRISNDTVELVVVPAIGRIMSFSFLGGENPLLENAAWFGKTKEPPFTNEWFNFGGDKLWPTHQSYWPKVQKRGWPPDHHFDGSPVHFKAWKDKTGAAHVRLVSDISDAFGVYYKREIILKPKEAGLTILQEYRKITTDSIPLAIWNVTQLKEPLYAVFENPIKDTVINFFPKTEKAEKTAHIKPKGNSWIVRKDSKAHQKFGSKVPGSRIAAVYPSGLKLTMWTDRQDGKIYEDQDAHLEVFTSKSEPYIELETLSPTVKLKKGQSLHNKLYWLLEYPAQH